MSNLKNNGHDILHNLEQLKPRLADAYEQWRAKDPRNATAPSELQDAYGAFIAPIVVSRAAKRSNSYREGQPQARAAVSQQYPMSIHPTLSMNDLSRDMGNVRINTSPQDRYPRVDPARRTQDDVARRQWEEEAERARRQDEEARAHRAQEDAARRQWDVEEDMRRRQREEQRVQAEQDRAQQARNAALNAARQAAGISADRYSNQSTRYRESSIASSVSSPPISRHNSGYDAVPHHPLQDPLLMRNEIQETSPLWPINHTPTATRSQPLYAPQIDTSFANGSVQYPQLMSAHQRAQGYQPSVMFPSPVTVRGGSSSLYNIALPTAASSVLNPPPRSSSHGQPTYSPAPPPPSHYPTQASPIADYHSYEAAPSRVPPRTLPQPVPAPAPPAHNTHRRGSSIPEVSRNPLGMRPIDMPVELLDRFLGVARLNTLRKVETCGLLLGKERGAGFTISTLLIPEQRGTQDTCTMESEELVVEFSTDRDLLTLGWIHTHPTQSCFMSSLDLHTHSAYQSTLKEAIAIVCAPTSDPKFGIFRLTDPPGLDTIMNCRIKETFHPHPEHLAIYTDCDGSHVRLVAGMHLEIVDLRRGQDFSSSEGTRGV
ncbi:hypothetical protein M408DRAFT_161238 [Serendipita vermifera MAFF 305830]|uniref:MPN domain-containing protein n=1 Tax=Serendipita vermifera MAFF 305830 TaxID=933852 RepID=A0A0C2XFP4_SERVB|nr:hypothetical protein M408DRAFT_161238 [Serendipita vermifera MAFF 305830]